jgi:hypothetical protein
VDKEENNPDKKKNISGGEKNELKPLPTASFFGREWCSVPLQTV